jgi:hypothetical protein
MQWHWGNVGSAVAGIAALIAAVAAVYGAIRYGPGWLRDSRERQQAQAAAARAQEALALEQAEQLRLDRRRTLQGWSSNGVAVYRVALATSAEEMDQAKAELLAGNVPSDYVILRVAESEEKYGNANRALSLRQLIDTEHFIARAPNDGEREALETGLDAMGMQWMGSPSPPGIRRKVSG